MSTPIRFLVEQYYDIQKLRIEAFNRIVALVKAEEENNGHISRETQPLPASHTTNESRPRFASHYSSETHSALASHITNEPRPRFASHDAFETQHGFAPSSDEPGKEPEEEEGKYADLTRDYISGKKQPSQRLSSLIWYFVKLQATEKDLAKRLDEWSKEHPLRTQYLSSIKGIGPIFSSAIIAWLEPIGRFDNISKLWAYCGLSPTQKREKGKKLNYNPHIKTLMWKIAASFEKQKPERSTYKRIYLEKKAYYLARPDLKEAIDKKQKGAKLHVRLMSMRYTEKRFLADLWLVWRKMEDLPITAPYAVAILHHEGYEQPEALL